eukprot:COSAG05_NODE_4679_length_1414_cov_1.312548_2_plen_194_part_01
MSSRWCSSSWNHSTSPASFTDFTYADFGAPHTGHFQLAGSCSNGVFFFAGSSFDASYTCLHLLQVQVSGAGVGAVIAAAGASAEGAARQAWDKASKRSGATEVRRAIMSRCVKVPSPRSHRRSLFSSLWLCRRLLLDLDLATRSSYPVSLSHPLAIDPNIRSARGGQSVINLKSTYCFCAHMHEIMKYFLFTEN